MKSSLVLHLKVLLLKNVSTVRAAIAEPRTMTILFEVFFRGHY